MKIKSLGFFFCVFCLSCAHSQKSSQSLPSPGHSQASYPESREENIFDVRFGHSVPDPFRWLEDGKRSDVKAWLSKQEEFTRNHLDSLPGRESVRKVLNRLVFDTEGKGVPAKRGQRLFYTRRDASKNRPQLVWVEGNSPERVLLDMEKYEDETASFDDWNPSWDGKKMAISIHPNNADDIIEIILDVETGKKIDSIQGLKYGGSNWDRENKGVYYTFYPSGPKIPEADRIGYAEVRYHRLGESQDKDTLVMGPTGDPTLFIANATSDQGNWLVIRKGYGVEWDEFWVKDLRKEKSDFIPVFVGNRAKGELAIHRDRLYLLTNWKAPEWRLLGGSIQTRPQWKELAKGQKGTVLESFEIGKKYLYLKYLSQVSHWMEARNLDGSQPHRLSFIPPSGVVDDVSADSGEEDHLEDVFIFYSSYTHPRTIYRLKGEVKGENSTVWWKQVLPMDLSAFEVRQVQYRSRSKDKTWVPMFIVQKKGTFQKKRPIPYILYGYGGFNISILPSYNAELAVWLDHGGGYAVANIRGGGENGEKWHQAGMKTKKQNVFDDFIAAAEYLIQKKYTQSDRLVIHGGSNGGLLVGAVATQRPELFRSVICDVPVLDMLRFHLYGDGKFWMSEWGSPDKKEEFEALMKYSPYHHVKAGVRYPSFFFYSSANDERVATLHARKMVAMLQSRSTGGPVLLRLENHAGHGGSAQRKAWVEEYVDKFSFLFSEIDKTAW